MKNRWIVSSLMSGAVALLILGGYAKQQKVEAVTGQEDHKTYQLTKPVSGEPSAVDLLNRVVLKLPRQVSVNGKSISGDFNISGIDGAVELNGISGSVEAKHLNGAFTVSGASGNVRVAVERISDAGLHVSNVSGSIYLRLASDLNAELSIGNTSGGVSNKIEGLALNGIGASSYSARLGLGGPRIVVSNVTGKIVLQRI